MKYFPGFSAVDPFWQRIFWPNDNDLGEEQEEEEDAEDDVYDVLLCWAQRLRETDSALSHPLSSSS